jgi:hypothetical protein
MHKQQPTWKRNGASRKNQQGWFAWKSLLGESDVRFLYPSMGQPVGGITVPLAPSTVPASWFDKGDQN